MSAKTRLVLADDHRILLAGLRKIIEAERDLEIVGEATTGVEAMKLVREQRPDVALVDISMPELGGIALTRRLTQEHASVRVIMLTLHEDRAYVNQALQAGARGYVLKRAAAENLIGAIRAVMNGGTYVDSEVARRLFDARPKRASPAASIAPVSHLTDRELQVLKLIALGHTNKEVSRRLDVGVKSVETYKARAAEKLALRTRAEIVRYASAQGWLADG
jgi:DNA-binding NarL/FixJ family response regulator